MAMMGSAWPNGQEQAMPGPHDDEFQFLDLNNINLGDGLNFDLGDFQNANGGHILQSQPREPIDITMGGTESNPMARQHSAIHASQMHHPITTTGVSHPSIPTIPSTMMPIPAPVAAIDEIDAQIQYLQQQKMQQQQRQYEARQQQAVAYYAAGQRQIIPPTPQSMELQAGTQFYTVRDPQPLQTSQQQQQLHHHQQQQQTAMYDRYQRVKEQDLTFTPLASPAVTPLETQFSPIDHQFTVPGAYFSPLTSPALVAQSDHHAQSLLSRRMPTNSNSPCEMEPEVALPPAASETGRRTKKTAVSKARKASVRQSPISKPQRRKNSSVTPLMNAQVLDQLAETLEAESNLQQLPLPAPIMTDSTTPAATDSENGSISPEHLSEMPPPPVPKSRSARPSPYMQAQTNAPPANHFMSKNGKPSPATPASLMKLPSPDATAAAPPGTLEPTNTDAIESFELPEAVNTAFRKRPAAIVVSTSQKSSPVIDPSTTPKVSGFQPLPSPNLRKPSAMTSASQSPQIAPSNSTTSASTPASSRKTPLMLPRGSKKRGSISSVQVSPALLPRISPNIKPLLPGGSTAEDHASRLLASKSNYQNIIEGNTVPGVSYPSALATNLTSKRTSHKIAEQGRRNRINSALQEMSALLPREEPSDAKSSEDGEGGDKKDKDKKDNNGPNSKASTVEMAIEYIKQLQGEIANMEKRLAASNLRADEAERKLAAQVPGEE